MHTIWVSHCPILNVLRQFSLHVSITRTTTRSCAERAKLVIQTLNEFQVNKTVINKVEQEMNKTLNRGANDNDEKMDDDDTKLEGIWMNDNDEEALPMTTVVHLNVPSQSVDDNSNKV